MVCKSPHQHLDIVMVNSRHGLYDVQTKLRMDLLQSIGSLRSIAVCNTKIMVSRTNTVMSLTTDNNSMQFCLNNTTPIHDYISISVRLSWNAS